MWIEARWAWSAAQMAVFALVAARLWTVARVRAQPLHWMLATAAAWSLLQLATGASAHPAATRDHALLWLTWLGCAWLGSQVERSPDAAFAWFATILAAVAIVGEFAAPGKFLLLFPSPYGERVLGPFVHPNQYAAFVELAVPATLRSMGLTAKGLVMAAVLAASTVVSASIAGAILVLAELMLLVALLGRRDNRGRMAVGLALCVAAFVAVTGIDLLKYKLFDRGLIWDDRVALSRSTVQMALDRPALGWGNGTWSTVYPSYATFDTGDFDNQAHNDWAQWSAEGGLPFLLLMVAVGLKVTAAAWRQPQGLGLVFVLVHCLVEYHFQQRPQFGCLYFFWAGYITSRATSASTGPPGPGPARPVPDSSGP
jgi:hypothetical protein